MTEMALRKSVRDSQAEVVEGMENLLKITEVGDMKPWGNGAFYI